MLREGDVFVVYKLDRLARSVKHLYEIMDIIRKKMFNLFLLKITSIPHKVCKEIISWVIYK